MGVIYLRRVFMRVTIISMMFIFCCTMTGIVHAGNIEPMELHAFYPAYITYSPDIEKYIDKLDSISFAWGRIYSDNPESLNTVKGQNGNYGFYYPEDFIKPVRYAKSKGKSILISVFTDGIGAEGILPYRDKRSKAINAILEILKKDTGNGESLYYDGVVIDFEGLKDTDASGKARLINGKRISTYFNTFLTELNRELDKLNKKLYVAVNPRLYFDGYDYKQIIKIADKMIIMAHDYEPTGALRKREVTQYTGYDALNPIDSLAPARKIKQALEDVKNSIENSAELGKVWLQLSFDSSQWRYEVPDIESWETLDGSVFNKEGRVTPTYTMIKKRIDNLDRQGIGISYGYNNELQCPSIQYFNKSDKTYNIIIYEDSKSIKAKMDMAKSYGLGGISIWSLGNIPDFNDIKGKRFNLNVWENILRNLNNASLIEPKQNEIMQFTNRKVEEAVRNRLSKPTGDIYKSDVAGIYRLKLPEDVTNISDLKYLTNLEYLDAQNAGISDLGPLSSLRNLRVLYLQRNRITNISPLKSLTKLQVLSLNGNSVSDISALAGLKGLTELYLRENRITDVSKLKGLGSLNTLYLEGNKITDLRAVRELYDQLVDCDFEMQ